MEHGAWSMEHGAWRNEGTKYQGSKGTLEVTVTNQQYQF
jgi:hypothetical protein